MRWTWTWRTRWTQLTKKRGAADPANQFTIPDAAGWSVAVSKGFPNWLADIFGLAFDYRLTLTAHLEPKSSLVWFVHFRLRLSDCVILSVWVRLDLWLVHCTPVAGQWQWGCNRRRLWAGGVWELPWVDDRNGLWRLLHWDVKGQGQGKGGGGDSQGCSSRTNWTGGEFNLLCRQPGWHHQLLGALAASSNGCQLCSSRKFLLLHVTSCGWWLCGWRWNRRLAGSGHDVSYRWRSHGFCPQQCLQQEAKAVKTQSYAQTIPDHDLWHANIGGLVWFHNLKILLNSAFTVREGKFVRWYWLCLLVLVFT